MTDFIQPEYSWFPLNSDKYMEIWVYSSIEKIENDIKDAICFYILNNKNWDILIEKVIKK